MDAKKIIDDVTKTIATNKNGAIQIVNGYISDMKKRPIVAQALVEMCEMVGNIPHGSTIEAIKFQNAEKELISLKGKHDELLGKVKELAQQTGYRSILVETFHTSYGELRALINTQGAREEVKIAPDIDHKLLENGVEVIITNVTPSVKCITEVRGFTYNLGRTAVVSEVFENSVAIDEPGTGSQLILSITSNIKAEIEKGKKVRYEPQTRFAFEIIESDENMSEYKVESANLLPFRFKDIGGLEAEMQIIKDRVIAPLLNKEIFLKYSVPITNGILLHGMPGNGKSMMACAIFNEISDLFLKKDIDVSDHFISVKSSQILSKWVGNSEKAVRDIFATARKVSIKSGVPAVIFWDEIESVMRARNESPSYSASSTLVPTLLTEMSGISEGGNVILIAASNRADLIDSALMRAGRLGDCKIKIPQPSIEAAKSILIKKLTGMPLKDNLDDIVKSITDKIYNDDKLLTIHFADGTDKIVTRADLCSGAIITKIVSDCAMKACMSEIAGGEASGVSIGDAVASIEEEFGNISSILRPHNLHNYIDLPIEYLNMQSKIVTQV